MAGVNLFPCTVTGPDGTVYQVCRVVAGPDGTQVWWWDRELGTARTVVESSYSPEQLTAGGRRYTLALDDGTEAAIVRQTGCGCGHPMKRWQLPKPVREAG